MILTAARGEFAAKGYDGSSIRAIARSAGVDPALVHHYFDGKADLFAASLALPVRPAELLPRIIDGPRDQIGLRMATTYFAIWDEPTSREPFVAMLRSAVSHDEAARMLREFLAQEVFGRVARAMDVPDSEVRAGLAAAQMVGLALLRYVVRYEPIVDASTQELVALVAPTLQRYLADADG